MEQLTMKDLENIVELYKKANYDLSKIRVYIGNDDELNGIHNAWYCEGIKNDGTSDMKLVTELINNDSCASPLSDDEIALLIS